jgi:hypothetical protein
MGRNTTLLDPTTQGLGFVSLKLTEQTRVNYLLVRLSCSG